MGMLETAHKSIHKAARALGLSEAKVNRLLEAEAEHVFEIEVDGEKHRAYRVQHSSARGPFKGGIRFHESVDLEETRALAMLMSLKTAAVGLPLGGGKGGVAFNPKNYSSEHIEAIARGYVRWLSPHIGPDKDVPAPDVNTDARVMDWMADEYRKQTGDESGASFTGKSLDNGGSAGRESATGRGGVIALREYIAAHPELKKPLTVAVQGVGNVGFYFAQIAQAELPVRIVALSDSKQTLAIGHFHENEYKISLEGVSFTRGLLDTIGSEHTVMLDRDDVLSLNADVLVCAALGDAITAENTSSVKAKIIIELANGPVDDEAHEQLTSNGANIIPDIVANAGGVIVSYLEWQQNKAGEQWEEATVNQKLDDIMSSAVRAMLVRAKAEAIPLRQAAYENALEALLR